MAEKIHFIMTGGTIDSHYDGIKDTAVPNEHSVIPGYIKSLKLYMDCEFTEVCMKDSRNITKDDLKNICNSIDESPHKKIIVTHGTYTMPDTARYLKANLKKKDKTIIFTGSMVPLIGFSPSDASFNLGFSVSKVLELPQGIYICMNGRVFSPKEIIKTIAEGRFSSIFKKK
ncbi:asparaginase [Candidatus Woesearchaeota archaeon]|nr:asparaginase [Candidatus Woesearchaeota archaeon]